MGDGRRALEAVAITVAVTGANGYVGGRLVATLAQRPDVTVRAFVRRPTPWLDVEQRPLAEPDFAGCAAVVHLAGPNEVTASVDPDGALASTASCTRAVADAAAAAGVARLVYASTVHVYGAALVPGSVVDESTAPAPRHPYAIARLAAEHVAASILGDRLVVLRLTNGVGAPADASVNRWSLVANDLCRQAVRTGELRLKTSGLQWRDFVPMADVCDALAGIATGSLAVAPGTYNLGLGRPTTVRSLADAIADVFAARTGTRPPVVAPRPVPGEVPPAPYRVDVGRLAAAGFTPGGDLCAALDETAAFCLDHRRALG